MWYQEKQDYLSSHFEEITPKDFYRELFPAGTFEIEVGHQEEYEHTGKGNGFLVYMKPNGEKTTRMIFDDLSEIYKYLDNECAFLSPISYFGRHRTMANARLLFAMVFDLDNVSYEQLELLFGWTVAHGAIPQPTYVVNSGNGVHLYYVFDSPIPMYPNIQKALKEMKYALTTRIWNEDTSQLKERQYQGINQGFRLVGSYTKNRERVTAWRTGGRISLAVLSQFVDEKYRIADTFYHSKMTLEQARKKYPRWYEQRIEQGRQKGSWTCKRALYDWWLRQLYLVAHHHRYHYVKCLAIYGVKCGVSLEEVRRDAYRFQKPLNDINPSDPFTEDDIKSALEMYQECWKSYPRDDIEKTSGIPCPANKRNGRSQQQHLEIARATQAIQEKYDKGNWRDGNGRKSVRKGVLEFLMMNPSVSYKEFCTETGLKKSVFYKYKKECKIYM